MKDNFFDKVMNSCFVCETMSVYEIGSQQCAPGHRWSVDYTDRYLIHYIFSGKGIFVCDGKEYHLSRGNAFLITGEKAGYYRADDEEPWHYMWINISGDMAKRFLKSISLSRAEPVYKTVNPDEVEKCFKELAENQNENSFIVSGAFHTLMGNMIRYSEKREAHEHRSIKEYVELCKNYIGINSYKRITMKMLCDYIGLEHSYLYRLFRQEAGMSPCEYIIDYKIKLARQLLEETALSVSEIAGSLGYDDGLAFSKLFSKKTGMPPSFYRSARKNKNKE